MPRVIGIGVSDQNSLSPRRGEPPTNNVCGIYSGCHRSPPSRLRVFAPDNALVMRRNKTMKLMHTEDRQKTPTGIRIRCWSGYQIFIEKLIATSTRRVHDSGRVVSRSSAPTTASKSAIPRKTHQGLRGDRQDAQRFSTNTRNFLTDDSFALDFPVIRHAKSQGVAHDGRI